MLWVQDSGTTNWDTTGTHSSMILRQDGNRKRATDVKGAGRLPAEPPRRARTKGKNAHGYSVGRDEDRNKSYRCELTLLLGLDGMDATLRTCPFPLPTPLHAPIGAKGSDGGYQVGAG